MFSQAPKRAKLIKLQEKSINPSFQITLKNRFLIILRASLSDLPHHPILLLPVELHLEGFEGMINLDNSDVHPVLAGQLERDHDDSLGFDLDLEVAAVTVGAAGADHHFLMLAKEIQQLLFILPSILVLQAHINLSLLTIHPHHTLIHLPLHSNDQ
jgi:hypothetical protein